MEKLQRVLTNRPLSLPLVLVAGVLYLTAALLSSDVISAAGATVLAMAAIVAVFFDV